MDDDAAWNGKSVIIGYSAAQNGAPTT